MTPSQRVDEWINEFVNHQSSAHNFDPDDKYQETVLKYIYLDKFKAIPRIVEIIDNYDPKRDIKNKKKSDRFDLALDIIRLTDSFNIRVRSSAEGMVAINALDRAVKRMRAAGFVTSEEKSDEEEGSDSHSLIEISESLLKSLSGVNDRDRTVKSALRVTYKIDMSSEEVLDFSNFLTEFYPDYPSWSEKDSFTGIGPEGKSVRIFTLVKPERYYEAYKEFNELFTDK